MKPLINSGDVAHQIIDGEAIIMHFKKGTYYSLEGTGAEIWSAIQRGLSVEELTQELSGKFKGDLKEISRSVMDLISELEKESIIRCDDAFEAPTLSEMEGIISGGDARLVFTAPKLSKFTDMEYLITTDPIHDKEDDEPRNLN